jgi:tetratricopeptide (TPR) repeat protein
MNFSLRILSILFFISLFIGCNNQSEEQKTQNKKERDSLFLVSEELYAKNNYKEAEKSIDKIKPIDEFDLRFYNLNAKIKFNCKKYTETILSVNTSLNVNKKNSALLFLKSNCYFALNRPDSGLFFINKAIDLNPKNIGYILARANMYKYLRMTDYQLLDIQQLIRLDTNSMVFKNYLNQYYAENNDTTAAIDGYKSILKIQPYNSNALASLGFIYFKMGDLKLSKQYLNKQIAYEPIYGDVFFILASINSQQKNKDKMCDCLLKSLELGCNEAGKHIFKCEKYLKKKGIIVRADTICKEVEESLKSTNI